MDVKASLFRCVYGPFEKTIYQFLLLLDRMRGLDFIGSSNIRSTTAATMSAHTCGCIECSEGSVGT